MPVPEICFDPNVGPLLKLCSPDGKKEEQVTLSNDGDLGLPSSAGKGILLKSPDGAKWRLTVDNAGVLATAKVV